MPGLLQQDAETGDFLGRSMPANLAIVVETKRLSQQKKDYQHLT